MSPFAPIIPENFEMHLDYLERSSCALETAKKLTWSTVNALTSESDQHLISPYSITPESQIRLTRK